LADVVGGFVRLIANLEFEISEQEGRRTGGMRNPDGLGGNSVRRVWEAAGDGYPG
jgi:hypothetical protein